MTQPSARRSLPMPALPSLPTLSRRAGFWLAATTLVGLMVAAAAPAPLYVVYQARWGFSAAALTLVFGIYAAALLATLVTLGGISDQVGRRPVLLAGLGLETASMVMFLGADGVADLLAARIVQGVATGLLTGTLTAVLVDLQPPDRPRLGSLLSGTAPTVGLAAGAVGAGLVARLTAAPTVVVFALLTAVFGVLLAAVVLLPDPLRDGRADRPGIRELARAARPRLAVPTHVRRPFLAAAPIMIASWATGGFYLSLAPSVLAGPLHEPDHLLGGALVATLNLAATAAVLAAGNRPPRTLLLGGTAALAAGTAVSLLAVATGSPGLLFAGTAVAGTGFGTGFVGAFAGLAPLAAAAERGDLFAAVYTVTYLAFSVPVVLAGLAVPWAGLPAVVHGYGAFVIGLCGLAYGVNRRMQGSPGGPHRSRVRRRS